MIASSAISGTGFPTEEGRKLAEHVLRQESGEREVDLRGMSSALLIGGFFFAFLQTVHDFQEKHVSDWMMSFKPN